MNDIAEERLDKIIAFNDKLIKQYKKNQVKLEILRDAHNLTCSLRDYPVLQTEMEKLFDKIFLGIVENNESDEFNKSL